MKKRAFTLVEIAIVLVVIAILLGIAVPQFLRSRAHSQAQSCISSLKKIDEAKEMWAIAYHKADGAAVQMADLVPDFITRLPQCPGGGTYAVGDLGDTPTCSLGGLARFAHKLAD